jgi:hypothetical protein
LCAAKESAARVREEIERGRRLREPAAGDPNAVIAERMFGKAILYLLLFPPLSVVYSVRYGLFRRTHEVEHSGGLGIVLVLTIGLIECWVMSLLIRLL